MKLRHTPLSLFAYDCWLEGSLSHAPDVSNLVLIFHTQEIFYQEKLIEALHESHQATLMMNLLSQEEQINNSDTAYNITLLSQRILDISEWARRQPYLSSLPQALVIFDTASGAGIRAGSVKPEHFFALVCHGGRPDLAGRTPLYNLTMPVRFILCGDDPHNVMSNQAFSLIRAPKDCQLISSEETEAQKIQSAIEMTLEWININLPPPPSPILEESKDK